MFNVLWDFFWECFVLLCRETTLHALRGVITPAGDKMSDAVKKQILDSLIGMLGNQDDVARSCAAGCYGAMCRWLTPDQLDQALIDNLLSKYFLQFL